MNLRLKYIFWYLFGCLGAFFVLIFDFKNFSILQENISHPMTWVIAVGWGFMTLGSYIQVVEKRESRNSGPN